MLRSVWAIAVVVFSFSPALSFDEETTKIDEYLTACVEAEQFNGAVLVYRGDEQLVCRGFGMANFEHDVPNTPQTKFRLGSVTKQFTAMAVMILQERGSLSVDDAISKFIDSSPDAWKDVTVRHLLTHTSGQSKVEVFPESESDFFLRVVDAQLTFVRDKDGHVTHLILHQGGLDQTAKRLPSDEPPAKQP